MTEAELFVLARQMLPSSLRPLPVSVVYQLPCVTKTESISPSPYLSVDEASALCGLKPRTLRNLLHARDALLLASRVPGKAYRFNRERFLQWIESRPDYARLPGVKKVRKKH